MGIESSGYILISYAGILIVKSVWGKSCVFVLFVVVVLIIIICDVNN